jgi:hypothetical protein
MGRARRESRQKKCGKGAEKCREMQINARKIPEGQLRCCSMGV